MTILFFRSYNDILKKKNKTKLVADVEIVILSSFVEFLLAISEEKSKMFQKIRVKGGHLVFRIGPKNTNLVENVEILLLVTFR